MTSKYLIPKDVSITNGVSLYLQYHNEYVQFQFPPTITGDSRRLGWNTKNLSGRDPFAIYENNSAREMSLKIEYIVEDQSTNNDAGKWSIGKIKHNVNLIKGYFSAVAGLRGGANGGNFVGGSLIAYFTHTLITGFDRWSVRLGNVDVTYDGPHIGAGVLSYPLKTTVNVDIATVSSDRSATNVYWRGIKRAPVFDDLWY